MLQLNQSKTTNTVAFYPDTPITSSAIVSVVFSGSQDYDRNPTRFIGDIISNYKTTPWVISEISGSSLPNASGFYTLHIYEGIDDSPYIWNLTDVAWNLLNETWDNANFVRAGEYLATERAFNSGSDVTPITQYVSPNENGAYTTYLG